MNSNEAVQEPHFFPVGNWLITLAVSHISEIFLNTKKMSKGLSGSQSKSISTRKILALRQDPRQSSAELGLISGVPCLHGQAARGLMHSAVLLFPPPCASCLHCCSFLLHFVCSWLITITPLALPTSQPLTCPMLSSMENCFPCQPNILFFPS